MSAAIPLLPRTFTAIKKWLAPVLDVANGVPTLDATGTLVVNGINVRKVDDGDATDVAGAGELVVVVDDLTTPTTFSLRMGDGATATTSLVEFQLGDKRKATFRGISTDADTFNVSFAPGELAASDEVLVESIVENGSSGGIGVVVDGADPSLTSSGNGPVFHVTKIIADPTDGNRQALVFNGSSITGGNVTAESFTGAWTLPVVVSAGGAGPGWFHVNVYVRRGKP